ncbi:MAG: hypothetical protein LBU53_13760 [Zoogloeaceae bacterium]|nr:hypothetical protein [Zoogloeaceae bacterium]
MTRFSILANGNFLANGNSGLENDSGKSNELRQTKGAILHHRRRPGAPAFPSALPEAWRRNIFKPMQTNNISAVLC